MPEFKVEIKIRIRYVTWIRGHPTQYWCKKALQWPLCRESFQQWVAPSQLHNTGKGEETGEVWLSRFCYSQKPRVQQGRLKNKLKTDTRRKRVQLRNTKVSLLWQQMTADGSVAMVILLLWTTFSAMPRKYKSIFLWVA